MCPVDGEDEAELIRHVPKHPERKASKARLVELSTKCEPLSVLAPTFKVEAPAAATTTRKSRSQIEAERAFNKALEEIMAARLLYEANFKRHNQTRQLGRAWK